MSTAKWKRKRVFITVKTYPVPSQSSIEVSCTAGITDTGEWVRLYPVPHRLLEGEKQFSRYQWVEVDVTRPKEDPRPESHKLNAATIKLAEKVGTEGAWRERRKLLKNLVKPSMCHIKRMQNERGHPTLGLFKPAKIDRLIIERIQNPDWTLQEKEFLSQSNMFEEGPTKPLEKIPYKFKYDFRCNDPECRGHTMMCTDWEMGQSYRRWRKAYGDGWEAPFRKRYEDEMINKLDTHFYVGTVHQHPKSWIIIGLFYPPYEQIKDLFG